MTVRQLDSETVRERERERESEREIEREREIESDRVAETERKSGALPLVKGIGLRLGLVRFVMSLYALGRCSALVVPHESITDWKGTGIEFPQKLLSHNPAHPEP